MDLKGRRVLVFGAGRSGEGAAELLLKRGAVPVIYDSNTALIRQKVLAGLGRNAGNVEVVTGELPNDVISSSDLCVISPGVPTDIEAVNRIRDAGVEIWGEVELAWRCSKGRVIAVTGTNGKTTTVTLLGELIKRHLTKENVFVVGNIGFPYTRAALKTTDRSVCVAEISSFQLETIREFHPFISAITNITPDHLDRHHTMKEYIRAKERIAENQDLKDVVVLNFEDEELLKFGRSIELRRASHLGPPCPSVLWFSCDRPLERGMYLERGVLKIAGAKGHTDVLDISELALIGKHNYENVCTAVLCALSAGMNMGEIREVLRAFRGLEHRIEFVGEKGGIAYYNDSKGTNPDAAIRAVEAMDRPTVLIGGGYDKDSSYDKWIESFRGRVKALVLCGETKTKIAECAAKHGFNHVYLCDTFAQCFRKSVELAQCGDAILLSPACASWGMFRDFEERGRAFKNLVYSLDNEVDGRK